MNYKKSFSLCLLLVLGFCCLTVKALQINSDIKSNHILRLYSLYLSYWDKDIKVSTDDILEYASSDASYKYGKLIVPNGFVFGNDSSATSDNASIWWWGKNNINASESAWIWWWYNNKITNWNNSLILWWEWNTINNVWSAWVGNAVVLWWQTNTINKWTLTNNEDTNNWVVIWWSENAIWNHSVALWWYHNKWNSFSLLLWTNVDASGYDWVFVWWDDGNPNLKTNSALMKSSKWVLIWTAKPVSNISMIVNWAIKLSKSNDNTRVWWEIKVDGGCFYVYNGSSWDLLNQSDSSKCESYSKKCKFWNIELWNWDKVKAYSTTTDVNCASKSQMVTCVNWILKTESWSDVFKYPYCYDTTDCNWVLPAHAIADIPANPEQIVSNWTKEPNTSCSYRCEDGYVGDTCLLKGECNISNTSCAVWTPEMTSLPNMFACGFWDVIITKVMCTCPSGMKWDQGNNSCVVNVDTSNDWPVCESESRNTSKACSVWDPEWKSSPDWKYTCSKWDKKVDCRCDSWKVFRESKCVDATSLPVCGIEWTCSRWTASWVSWESSYKCNASDKSVECFCPNGKKWNDSTKTCDDNFPSCGGISLCDDKSTPVALETSGLHQEFYCKMKTSNVKVKCACKDDELFVGGKCVAKPLCWDSSTANVCARWTLWKTYADSYECTNWDVTPTLCKCKAWELWDNTKKYCIKKVYKCLWAVPADAEVIDPDFILKSDANFVHDLSKETPCAFRCKDWFAWVEWVGWSGWSCVKMCDESAGVCGVWEANGIEGSDTKYNCKYWDYESSCTCYEWYKWSTEEKKCVNW